MHTIELEDDIMLNKLIALDGRTPTEHQEKVNVHSDLIKEMTKKKGERTVHFPLRFINKEMVKIIHSTRLPDENGFFQLDTLLLTRFFALILEVKNWYGTLLFDRSGQVIRIGDNQIEEGFPNPIPQLYLQRFRLQKWFSNLGVNSLPIVGFIVTSFPSTILKTETPSIDIPKEIIRSEQLLVKINQLLDHYTEKVITPKSIGDISKKIIQKHTPRNEDVLFKYGISTNELRKGVICVQCSVNTMMKRHKYWRCNSCGFQSETVYLDALNDYRLLIGNKVKNEDIRKYLLIDSPYVVKRLMLKAGFKYEGIKKGRVYNLDMLSSNSLISQDNTR